MIRRAVLWLAVLAGAAVVSVALVLGRAPGPARAAAPAVGILVPGVSLGGIEVGMTRGEVLGVWGARHGVCRDCRLETWYFNRIAFEPEGAGVVFRRGRVAHVFTLWQPPGWRTSDGLELGADEAEIGAGQVLVDERTCIGYTARLASTGRVQTVYYVYDGRLWGFGLVRAGANPCL
jgi:hypothetical protein